MLREMEGKRSWWCGRTSNPVGGVSRSRVGSTPTPFRHFIYVLMGTDAPESMGFTVTPGNNLYINLEPDTRTETDRLFRA